MSVATIGLIYRSKKKIGTLGFDYITVIITYIITIVFLFYLGIPPDFFINIKK